MSVLGLSRTRARVRRWPVLNAARAECGYIALIDLLAVVAVGWAATQPLGGGWAVVVLLAALAVVFDEVSRRAARLQIRLSSGLRVDMSSVWAVAGAVVLPPTQAVVLVLAFSVHAWFRHQRPVHELLYRKVFVLATIVLGCLVAGAASRGVGGLHLHGAWSIKGLTCVVVAIAVYTLVNRGLVSVVVLMLGGQKRDLVGTGHDNLVEVATLCLGGLVSIAVVYDSWLAVLVLAPMVTLQRGALVRELEVAATTDVKTGLLNAVAWEQVAQREVARAERTGGPLAVLIVDIDHFKAVNDLHGHLAGDAVLRAVATRMTAAVREYDTIGRFGGEEFVAVLPDADVVAAFEIAERIRLRVNSTGFDAGFSPAGGDEVRLSISIGVACLVTNGQQLDELLWAADRALYRAKALGRDRVECAGPDPVTREDSVAG